MDDIISHMLDMGINYSKYALLSHKLFTCHAYDMYIMIVHAIVSPCTYHAARDTQSAVTVTVDTRKNVVFPSNESALKEM